ncbi:MAG: HAMP domain-containing histidine kinase, partial [Duncaniella sp.]|nr:HAMP domain-containing histidine kinase [Duncaniella sp.]
VKEDGQSYNNLFAQAIGRQFHAVIDSYLELNLTVMDSVLLRRLNDRFIYPEFVSTEIIEGDGKVIVSNPKYKTGNYDEFTYCFNPEANRSYRVYITSLTRHIFSEMAGVIVTVFLLMAAFSLAFGYLFRTVSRLRTIEEMKDDFVNNMTHELKTPISIAYSANDALLHYDTANDPAKKETYLTIANKQLKRLGELVENILAMSMERRKTMQLRPETIHLSPFINEIAAAQRMRGEKEITIDVETSEETTVYADKTHLANILNNLIDNSIKYSGDSVRITVKCDGNGIAVSDNGIGIPAKSIPFLFNKFYRVPHGNRQDTRGYGIGLYYVKCMAEKMGWTVAVRSSAGKGSTFFIDFCKDEG